MSGIRSAFAWALLAVMVGGQSMITTVESRRIREQGEEASVRLVETVRSLGKRLDLTSVATGAALRSIQKRQEDLRAEMVQLKGQLAQSGTEMERPGPPVEIVVSPENVTGQVDEMDALPPVPEGIISEDFLAGDTDLKVILDDTRFNPGGKQLGRTEKLKAQAELTRARATMQIIESDLRASIAEGMEDLRKDKAFVEYAQGEAFDVVEGVLSAGEEMQNQGARIFYFYPEEFPNIYAKKQERGRAAERALRKVLELLGD